MKLHILSDLHLGVAAFEPPRVDDADVVVLAGDIARPHAAIDWACGFGKPVVYVPGNHEYYGLSLDGAAAELARRAAGTPVRLLDDGEAVIGGVRFLGSTLWTDFALYAGDAQAHAASIEQAQRHVRDFSRIRRHDGADDPFTPADAAQRFRRHAAWLAERLATPHDGPTVVVTHHAPSTRSIHPRWAGSPVNAAFVSDAEHLLAGAALWIHGHTHDSFDYRVDGGTRVVCNPRGYVFDGRVENAHFDPRLTVDVA